MKKTTLDFKKEIPPTAILGYLFRVSDRGLINETIVECIKKPEL